MSGKGLFWGNRLKVCETVYIDELTCQSRQLRDCNYQTIVYKGNFVGCFYCRGDYDLLLLQNKTQEICLN